MLVAGMDLHSTPAPGQGPPDTLNVEIFDENDVSLGTTTADASGPGDFWGVSSTAPIGRISMVSVNERAEGVDNVSFAGAITAVFQPVALEVDFAELASDGNAVFEPVETVDIAPTWRNDGPLALAVTGEASDFTGPVGPDYSVLEPPIADYGMVDAGATAGCRQATGVCYGMEVGPSGVERPAQHWEAQFEETLSEGSTKTWTLHIGDSFPDVPRTLLFYRPIEAVLHAGVVDAMQTAGLTSGCAGTRFCPASATTRADMPLFLLRSLVGPEFEPPACEEGAQVFTDVPFDDPACPWIEELADRQVTVGCGNDAYCPDASVTRAQMAVFLLKTLEGGQYVPPSCQGMFDDLPCTSPFAAWAEDLFARGITTGCAADPLTYCPASAVTRGQMAAFVTRTFGLELYGP